jgi:hypothetical protein
MAKRSHLRIEGILFLDAALYMTLIVMHQPLKRHMLAVSIR